LAGALLQTPLGQLTALTQTPPQLDLRGLHLREGKVWEGREGDKRVQERREGTEGEESGGRGVQTPSRNAGYAHACHYWYFLQTHTYLPNSREASLLAVINLHWLVDRHM